jgi:hypothetical protein
VTGSTYSIAECGEQLAWLTSVLQPSRKDSPTCYRPSITSVPYDQTFTHAHRRTSDAVSFRVEASEDTTYSNSPQDTFWHKTLPMMPAIAIEFPTVQRPEPCSGLGISFHTLLEVVGASEITLHSILFRLKGSRLHLQMVKRIGNVFCWYEIDYTRTSPHLDFSSLGAGQNIIRPAETSEFDLETGRHVVCPLEDYKSSFDESKYPEDFFSFPSMVLRSDDYRFAIIGQYSTGQRHALCA